MDICASIGLEGVHRSPETDLHITSGFTSRAAVGTYVMQIN